MRIQDLLYAFLCICEFVFQHLYPVAELAIFFAKHPGRPLRVREGIEQRTCLERVLFLQRAQLVLQMPLRRR